MIQFNLLPDVKQQYVKARRLMRLVTLASFLAIAAGLFVFLLLIVSVDVVQKKNLRDLNNDITKYTIQLKAVPDLNKMLTIQNQLNTITGLHDQKVVASRLPGYIAQVTPLQASISKLTVSYVEGTNTMQIEGEAPSLDIINTYTDTLKATTFKTDADGSQTAKAFSSVVLTAFGRDSKNATYTINLNYDSAIFNSANQAALIVPTGANTAQTLLFQKQAGK